MGARHHSWTFAALVYHPRRPSRQAAKSLGSLAVHVSHPPGFDLEWRDRLIGAVPAPILRRGRIRQSRDAGFGPSTAIDSAGRNLGGPERLAVSQGMDHQWVKRPNI